MAIHTELSNFIWGVADILRGPYRPPQYERVMLPLTVLRRFDCVLQPTKSDILSRYAQLRARGVKDNDPVMDQVLNQVAGGGTDLGFHNHSQLDFAKLLGDSQGIAQHLTGYIQGFSANVRQIFEYFEFEKEIDRMEQADILFKVVRKFNEIDLHPNRVDNIAMGLLFEDLIRRFNEAANETAGDHFTPREVIQLIVNLLLEPDDDFLRKPGVIKTICDPACGTGGMLAEAQNWLREHNPDARLVSYGQDYNPRSYAVAASDLLIKGHKDSDIKYGNTLTNDQFPGLRFDYLLANPPFGVDWKSEQSEIKREHEKQGFNGRFGPGTPRVNDGALLFLLHMISKFETYDPDDPEKPGSRLGIVFNGSPLFSGGAGSGESEIRRWIIEKDWLEAIVALPEAMFYNTGIGTYVWIVTNRKSSERAGEIQLIDGRERWKPGASPDTRRSLGDKRRHLGTDDIEAICREHGEKVNDTRTSKVFPRERFGYRRIAVERPLRRTLELSDEATEEFLARFPEEQTTIDSLIATFGKMPHLDWNEIAETVEPFLADLRARSERGRENNKATFFGEVFLSTSEDAAPVVKKRSKKPRHKDAISAERYGQFPVDGEWIEYETNSDLRNFENVPLEEDVDEFFDREVKPYRQDAWINPKVVDEKDGQVGKVGYEISFNRYFFQYEPPRLLEEIDSDLETVERRIQKLLEEVTA